MNRALEILKEYGSVTLEAFAEWNPDHLLERFEATTADEIDDFMFKLYARDYVYVRYPN